MRYVGLLKLPEHSMLCIIQKVEPICILMWFCWAFPSVGSLLSFFHTNRIICKVNYDPNEDGLFRNVYGKSTLNLIKSSKRNFNTQDQEFNQAGILF